MKKLNQYALLTSFLIAFSKTLLISPTAADIAAMAVIGALYSYLEYKNKDKDLENLALTVKKQGEEIAELKDKVSSIKFVQQMKPSSLNLR